MAGIYIHIPFCTKACNYCDFHFSTSLKLKSDLVSCINKEIENRKNYLNGAALETIYFGGGTPSLLAKEELKLILNQCFSSFNIAPEPEITLEANPDDLTKEKLLELKEAGINRLSIGIQSFNNEVLSWMNRSHNSTQAFQSVKDAQAIGITNISIDLIYGTPNMSIEAWEKQIELALSLNVPHISAYCLTVEEKTVLHKQVSKGLKMPKDETSLLQFKLLIEKLDQAGFIQYEISNFSKPNQTSKHNSSYWKSKPYLGVGPSAHSYNGKSRRWNIANNSNYIKGITQNTSYWEEETIDITTGYNEYVLTKLRTIWGIDLIYLQNEFGKELRNHFEKEVQVYLTDEKVIEKDHNYSLTLEGKFIADQIASDLFFVE